MGVATAEKEPPKVSTKWGVPNRVCTFQLEILGRNATRDQSPYQKKGYLGGRNNQTQRNGFGTFVQKFQTVGGKSKYGVPIFLPNGNVNPAYLAAERAEIQSQSKFNTVKAEKKRKDLIKQGKFQLADYIKKAIGDVGSGKEYYQSGR